MNLKSDIAQHSEATENNFDYLRSLYLVHGQSVTYKRILSHTVFSPKKFSDLQYELSKIQLPEERPITKAIVTSAPLEAAQASPFLQALPEKTLPTADASTETAFTKLQQEDPQLVALRKRKGDLFREYNMLFHTLPTINADADRRAPIKRIKEIWTEISNIWTSIQEFETNGFWPEVKQEEKSHVRELSVAELVNKAKNLPTYISRNKRQRDKATTAATKQKYQDLMDKASLELAEVSKRINEL